MPSLVALGHPLVCAQLSAHTHTQSGHAAGWIWCWTPLVAVHAWAPCYAVLTQSTETAQLLVPKALLAGLNAGCVESS